MPLSAKVIADEIAEHLRRESLDVLTMRWPAFYSFCERDRMKDAFMDSLVEQLNARSIMFAQGRSVVAFVKDFDFSPMTKG